MKRIIALFLAVITLLSMLSGCMSATSDSAMTMGQWVTLIADSFGLQNYVDEDPHFLSVSQNDSTFSAFQAVAEWGIIEPSNEITSTTPVTWNDVLISIVNAGDFLDKSTTDKEKINYAIKEFDPSIRTYWGKRYIKMKDAIPLLDAAQKKWANKVFCEKIEKTVFANTVINNIDNNSLEYISNGDIITTTSEELKELKVGDVYTLPANENTSASINRVKNIEYVDDKVIITNDANFNEEEVGNYIEEIKIQETSSPDFTQITGIYDENGNPINFEVDNSSAIDDMSAETNDYQFSTLSHTITDSDYEIQQLGLFDKVKSTLKFKVGQYSVSLTATNNSLGVKLSKEFSKTSNRYREEKKEAYVSTTFKDVELTRDVDYSWGKLHSATVKLDYSTKIEGGIKTERSGKIGNPTEENEETTKSLSSIFNQYKTALSDLKKDVRNSKCDDEIYICKLSFLETGIASADFILKGKVTAEGDIKLVVEVEGSQGIQVKDGKFRFIKTKDVDVDFAAEAKLEVTISPGVAITILKKVALIEFTIDCGLGASVGMTAHLFDIEGHELYSGDAQLTAEDADNLSNEKLYTTPEEIEEFAKQQGGTWDAAEKGITGNITIHKGICLDWKLYPIVRFGISGKSLIGTIAKKFNVSLSVELLGSKTPFLHGHMDFPNNLKNMLASKSIGDGLSTFLGINAECTYDYTPWDKAIEKIEEADPAVESNEISRTETISLSTMRVEIKEGNTAQISVTGLPEGYTLKDIEAEIDDSSIATFDIKEGQIAGKKEGITQIMVKTKDGKYKAFCAVVVTTDKKIDFNGLPSTSSKGV